MSYFNTSGVNFTTISGGAKYYAGNIPLKANIGLISSSSGFGTGTEFLARVSAGYAIRLADNVNLEPSLGLLISNGSALNIGLNFAMFL